MKRKRNSTQKGNEGGDNYDPKQIQIPDSSITDLPGPIIVDILLKLSVKSILISRCVCKNWRSIISDPQFAKLQHEQAEPCVLLYTVDSKHVSRTLYLVEPKDCHNFDLGYCICDHHTCSRCDRHVKLDTKLKIPLRNAEMVLSREEGDAQMGCIRVRPNDQNFKIVNFCNGFLCLSEPSCNEPLVVCNPITGEFINLPAPKRNDEKTPYFVDCGFGFSPRTNQYKVIRMFERWIGDPPTHVMGVHTPAMGRINYSKEIEIYTLGEGSWKSIGDAPFCYSKLLSPTYLEGCVHWLLCLESGGGSTVYIVSFSFDNEQLQLFPSPPRENDKSDIYCAAIIAGLSKKPNVSMGVLDGCLCICDASGYDNDTIDIWVMKKYGVRESWTKVFSIDNQPHQGRSRGLYQPINYLKNGAVLMFHYLKCVLICYDTERSKFKYLKICGAESKFEAISYAPSFISLKEAIVGDNVAVLNMSSRCGRIKVQGETKALSLAEEDRETEVDSDCSSSDKEWLKNWWERY
ncbi:F-box protein At3g07870-like isoform X2 [Cornus florida]|nr:F-box protein At3g07870-like isoform X2 [Cornus florida]